MFGNVPQMRLDQDHFALLRADVDAALAQVGAAASGTAVERDAAATQIIAAVMDMLNHFGWAIPRNDEKLLSAHLNKAADASQRELS